MATGTTRAMRCFVIRGFGSKKDTEGREIDFDQAHQQLIAPALQDCGLVGDTTVEVVGAGQIHQDMFMLIMLADIVICDITVHNPNVFYELGVRHALRRKHTVLIKGEPSADRTPFDIAGVRYLTYPVAAPANARQALVQAIDTTIARDRETDSPVFLMLPQLRGLDVNGVTPVPLDLVEEVQLATARADRGWLRVLAEDVRDEIFAREALRLIGRSQWELTDYAAAVQTWEAVRLGLDGDEEANFALANVYERLYKQTRDSGLLEQSNQAIRRLLERDDLPQRKRSEALALHGRNLKTLWRLEFADLPTLDERRERAVDLNHFFSGLAALQMGRIVQSLSALPDFDGLLDGVQRRPKRYLEDLADELDRLRHVAQMAVESALSKAKGDELIWARISAADLRFLEHVQTGNAGVSNAVVLAYRDAVPKGGFYWNSARGQLELFEQLGLGAPTARAVIDKLDGLSAAAAAGQRQRRHLVLFSGHTVDKVGAAPRFPDAAQAAARGLIEAELQRLQGLGDELEVLCSAAPGADILALEVCQQLQLTTWLCLPLDRDAVAREVYRHHDDRWRNRFLALSDAHRLPPPGRVKVMRGSAALPSWLRHRKDMTVWSRGNRWMLHNAQAWGADQVSLVVLWNRNVDDPSSDGCAAMVRLAQDAGIAITHLDSSPLVAA